MNDDGRIGRVGGWMDGWMGGGGSWPVAVVTGCSGGEREVLAALRNGAPAAVLMLCWPHSPIPTMTAAVQAQAPGGLLGVYRPVPGMGDAHGWGQRCGGGWLGGPARVAR